MSDIKESLFNWKTTLVGVLTLALGLLPEARHLIKALLELLNGNVMALGDAQGALLALLVGTGFIIAKDAKAVKKTK